MSIFLYTTKKGFYLRFQFYGLEMALKNLMVSKKQVDSPPINVPTNVDDRSPINHSLFYTIGEI